MINLARIKKNINKINIDIDALSSIEPSSSDRAILESHLYNTLEQELLQIRKELSLDAVELKNESSRKREMVKFEILKNNILQITMPRLLKRTKGRRSDVLKLYDSMYASDFNWFREHSEYTVEGKFVIWYQHCYNKSLPVDFIDHDNLETKTITDMVVRTIGRDDSPKDCHTFVSSIIADQDVTIIRIVPYDIFVESLKLYNERRYIHN